MSRQLFDTRQTRPFIPDRSRPAQPPQTARPIAALLGRMAYTLLLIAAALTTAIAIHFRLNFTLINLLFLVGNFGYLALLERIIPFDADWYPEAREWGRDGIYFAITMLGGGMALVSVVAISKVVAPLHSALPLWVEIPLALVLNSLTSYLFHRLQHIHPWLWRVHGVHHVPAKVNLSNNSVNHIFDVLGRRFVTQLPLLLLGISQPAIFAASVFTTAQGYFVHANIDVRLGWLNYLLTSPEQHRLHHSTDVKEAGHFGVDLSIWDLLFRTFTWYPKRRPAEVGVPDRTAFPASDAILSSLLHPFRRTAASRNRPLPDRP